MIKKLTTQGNSSALIIDKTLMGLLGIHADSFLKLTLDGQRLVVVPLSEQERKEQFDQLRGRTSKKNARRGKRLAK